MARGLKSAVPLRRKPSVLASIVTSGEPHTRRDCRDRASLLSLQLAELARIQRTHTDGVRTNGSSANCAEPCDQLRWSYPIFEGTSEIQRLVIARAISGMRVE
jgi:hypothetical protein